MYLPPFDYVRAPSVGEAIDTLAERGDEAAVYMGGTELLLLMKLGLAAPGCLVDCKRIEELRRVTVQEGHLRIGAAVTHRTLERSATVREVLPELCALESCIGNVRVRASGTLGGNLCFADPHSDPTTLLTALEASIRLSSPLGTRDVGCDAFVTGPYEACLGEAEIMTSVSIPLPPTHGSVAYDRIAFRERPIVNVAIVREADRCRIVAAGGWRAPRRCAEAEALLNAESDSRWAPDVIEAAAETTAATLDPLEDPDGGAAYKRHLTTVIFQRAAARVNR